MHLQLIDRYVLKRVSWPLAAAILIGMAALLLERLIRLLDLFANRGGPLTLILRMLGNLVPHYLAIALPAAFFVGILYATLRMSNDSELDVMRASGLSLRRLATPMMAMAVVLTVASVLILGFFQPYTRYAYRALVYLVTETSWNSAIERGAFFSGFGGKTILIGDIAEGGRALSRVFIQETDEQGNNIALSAQTGELTNDRQTFSLTLVLRDGIRVESKPDGTGGKALEFTELALPLEVVTPEPFRDRGDSESELNFIELIRAYVEKWPGIGRDDLISEINYRIVRALTVLFLPLLAIPIGLSSRRSPASTRIVAGIAILILYYQLLQFGKQMAENGRLGSFVAIWIPFLVFAAGSAYAFHIANSRIGQDPFSALFGLIDDAWGWCRRRWVGLAAREACGMIIFMRYALRTFLWNFFVLWISFTALLQIVDLLGNSDEVLDRHPGDVSAVVEYALWRLPELAVFLIPFSVLMATLLSLAKFERNNETLALKSAGAPYYQILLAFLPAVGLVAVLHFVLTDQIVPRSINHLMQDNLYVDKKNKDDDDDKRVWVQEGNTVVEVGEVQDQGLVLLNMRLYARDDLGNIVDQKFVERASYDLEARQWTLTNIEETRIVVDRGTEVIAIPSEVWNTQLGPQEFSELIERPQAMTTERLWGFAASTQLGVRPTYFYETWLQKRIALPVSSILMILLAAPVALSFGRRDRGVASGMAIGFGLGFLYFITEGLVLAMGESGAVPPFFAAWLPALLFASIGGLWLIRLEGF